ncbi:MAG: hypothetical protein OEU26_11085 [Candidatus Tectomicrobia bacterium]|nr:hypothetical protein [Candidatus Tectomicrobia bacterium]
MLFERTFKKVQFAGYHGYLVCSTLRFLPGLFMLLFLLGVWNWALNWQARQNSKPILAAIRGADLSKPPQGEELQQLWRLAKGSQRLKNGFLKEAISDPAPHAKLTQRRAYISQSVFGIDPYTHKRRTLLERLLKAAQEARYRDSKSWYAFWSSDMFSSAPERLSERASDIGVKIVEAMKEAMKNPSDPWQLSSLDIALGMLGDKLPAHQAEAGAQQIIEAM